MLHLRRLTWGILVVAGFGVSTATSRAVDFRLLPANTEFVLTINVKQILDSELVKTQPQAIQQIKGFGKLIPFGDEAMYHLKQMGFDPLKDLTSITVASPGPQDGPIGPFELFIIIDMVVDPVKFSAAARAVAANTGGLRISKLGQIEVYEISAPTNKKVYAALLGGKSLVLTAEKEALKAAIERSTGNQIAASKVKKLLKTANDKQSVNFAMSGPFLSRFIDKAEQLLGPKSLPLGKYKANIEGLNGAITITKEINFQVGVAAKDEKTAKEMAAVGSAGLFLLKVLLAGEGGKNPDLAPFVDIVGTLRISAVGSGALLNGNISAQNLEKIKNGIASLLKMAMFVPAGTGQDNPAKGALPPLPEPTRPEKGVLLYRVNLGKEMPCRQVRVYLPEKPARAKVPCVLVGPTGTTARDLDGTDPEEYLPYVRVGFAVVAYAFDDWGVPKTGKELLKAAGKLTADDPRDGRFAKSPRQTHALKLEGGKRVWIDLTSMDVDSYLRVEDETGKVVAEDDDSGGDWNSRLAFTPAKNGTYGLVVTCFPNNPKRPGLTGAYVLTVTEEFNAELAQMRACMKDEHGLGTARQALDYALAKVPVLDPDKIYTAGHSNGGFLSLLVASRDKRIKGCICCNGVADLDRHMRSWFALASLYWFEILDEPGFWEFVHNSSPMTHVGRLRCPVYLFHTRDDLAVPVKQIDIFIEELKKTNKNVTVDIVEKGGHVEPMVREGRPRAIRWLEKLAKE